MGLDSGSWLSSRYVGWLLEGLGTTVGLWVASLLLSLIVALPLVAMRDASFKVARGIAAAFVEYHRNTPALVQLFFWYFGIPTLLPEPWQQWIYRHNGEFLFAVIALALITAAYMSEDVRSGIRATPHQQREASTALGFTAWQALVLIILPQAIRIAMPALIGRSLLLLKNTSLAMAVGVGELLYQARQVESMTFRAYEAFAFATVCYLCLTLSLMALGKWFERTHTIRR